MTDYPNPLAVAAKGALAGAVGTAAITLDMQKVPALIERRFDISMTPEPPPDADIPEDPRAELAGRVATGVLERPLPEEGKVTAGQAIHWSYGTLWGVVYGILHSGLRLPALVHGMLFGSVVGAVASTVLPAMGLAPSPTEQPKRISAAQVGYHLVFGWTTALTFWLLTLRD